MITDMPEANNFDRVLKLQVIDDKLPKSAVGNTDSRLFNGDVKLHLTMDQQTSLWSFRYSTNAPVPGALQGQYTSFSKGLDHATRYFEKRNVRLSEIM